MFNLERHNSILDSGIEYLNKIQQKDGSFISLSSPDISFKKAIKFHSIFSSALILTTLSNISSNKVKDIQARTASFLLSQKSKNWSWNYWERNSKEYKTMPYPDDLDDTFCAITALYKYDPKLITGDVLANVTQMLTTLEVKEGGPYKTWLIDSGAEKAWQDVDLGVNANIDYFLHLQDVSLPNLIRLFDQAIKNEKFVTPYYPTPFPVLYFISRFIKGRDRIKMLQGTILKLEAKEPLDIALKTLALLNLKYPIKKLDSSINSIVKAQNKNGSWAAFPFYTGVNPKKNKKFYSGSPALTTAFCLEAISRYSRVSLATNKLVNTKLDEIDKLVIARVEKRFSELGVNLQKEAKPYLKQVLKNNKDKQITLLPLFFAKSLGEQGELISKDLIINLGMASVYGWLAYTIYDNFLDEEARLPSLPLANVCLRELTKIFNSILPKESGFQIIFQEIMDKLEEANTWEVTHCRDRGSIPDYGDYSQLANKSLGHALGCVAILMSLGLKENSLEVSNLLAFFNNFLIARQLNDDAHDWKEDLKLGHINSVGVMLLLRKSNGLQKLFWSEVIDEVCDLILIHSNKARSALSKINSVKDQMLLMKLVEKQEKSVEIARSEKEKTLSFLKNYVKNTSTWI